MASCARGPLASARGEVVRGFIPASRVKAPCRRLNEGPDQMGPGNECRDDSFNFARAKLSCMRCVNAVGGSGGHGRPDKPLQMRIQSLTSGRGRCARLPQVGVGCWTEPKAFKRPFAAGLRIRT